MHKYLIGPPEAPLLWSSPDAVEAAIAAAVTAERERCAKLCEESDLFEYDDPGGFFARLVRELK